MLLPAVPVDGLGVVPARALSELNRLLGEEEEPITLQTNAAKSQILFRLANTEMIDGDEDPAAERRYPLPRFCLTSLGPVLSHPH